ncbi:MAG: ABC transporter permease, partial [Gemmobacter sp.]
MMRAEAGLALRIARRELRGGVRGFRVFLACLALGVAAIAAVGHVRGAIEAGLAREGAVILGGDAQLEFTYRFANEAERDFMARTGAAVSEIVDFRSMAVVGEGAQAERGLTQVKAVDDAYPLLGSATLDPPRALDQALAGAGGLPGAVMDPILAARLGIAVGDRFALGLQQFHLSALLVREPDSAAGGFGFGPRTIVRTADLAQSGLIGPGTLYDTEYRLRLPPGADLDALRAEAQRLFRDSGMRWTDRRRAAPGVENFVDRMGSFLVLVGLAGLAVGGVGVSAAVRAYLDRKTETIATLRTLGASGRLILWVYLAQIGALTAVGVGAGLILSLAVPYGAGPLLAPLLPMPAVFAAYPAALAEAAFYGVLTAFLFTLWPLAAASEVRAAALYRAAAGRARGVPKASILIATGMLALLLVGGAAVLSGLATLA